MLPARTLLTEQVQTSTCERASQNSYTATGKAGALNGLSSFFKLISRLDLKVDCKRRKYVQEIGLLL